MVLNQTQRKQADGGEEPQLRDSEAEHLVQRRFVDERQLILEADALPKRFLFRVMARRLFLSLLHNRLVQIQQSLGYIHRDASRGVIHRAHHLWRHRDQ